MNVETRSKMALLIGHVIAYNLKYFGGRNRRMEVQDSPGKVTETPSQPIIKAGHGSW
jgi:hypothetical protein